MITLKYHTLFLPHKREAEDEDAHLVCRIKWNASRSQVSLNLGYTVDPDKWDAAAQMCQKRTIQGRLRIPSQRINNEIARYQQAVDKVFGQFAMADIWPTAEQVRSAVLVELGIEAPKIVRTEQAFDAFLREESVRCAWSHSTIQKMNTVKKHLSQFPPFNTFDGFTSSNLSGYLEFLRETKGHNDTTCHRQLGYIKWFCAWAEKKHYLTCDDYREFNPKLKHPEKPVIYLNWDELMKVWNYEGTGQLNTVRDIFLFSCFTSLRYSDVMALTWDNVTPDDIKVVTQKTAKALTIQLNKWSEEILSRYIDVAVPGNYVFPRILNQVCNRLLKTIGKSCGINERVVVTEYHGAKRTDQIYEKWGLLGTHAGRRTFVCNALMMGIPPTVVMQWTGHTDYRAMKPYIDVSDKSKTAQMGVFNKKSVTP